MLPKKQRPVVLSLIQLENPKYPRYMIADQYLRYWKGEKGWTEQNDSKGAEIYSSSDLALKEMQNILLIGFQDKPCRRFVAPMVLDLYTDQDITLEEVKAWLSKVSKFLVDAQEHGNGPLQGSLGLCRIELNSLTESKSKNEQVR